MKRHKITLQFFLDEDELEQLSAFPEFDRIMAEGDHEAIDQFNQTISDILDNNDETLFAQFHDQVCEFWGFLDHSPLKRLAKVAK